MIPRLHHGAPLSEGAVASLTQQQAHYLKNVLRREAGAEIRLFNKHDGEYAATISEIDKKSALAALGKRTLAPQDEPDIELYFAPVKRTAMEFILQKGAELGVMRFQPVMTDHTNSERLRIDRMSLIALEAAEQCGRLSIPEISAPVRLPEALLKWDTSRALIYCDEAGDDPGEDWGGRKGRAAPLIEAIKDEAASRAAILIGPEGGFSKDERAWLRALPYVRPVTLGPRILRADTAALVAIALWQAAKGDLTQN